MPMMSGRVKLLALVLLPAVAVCPWVAHAFGSLGHRLAGEVAEVYLCEPARTELAVLNGRYSFSTAGSWADKVRYRKEWAYTRPWHYMNIENAPFSADTPRSSKGDVLSAIYRYRDQLASTDSDLEQRRVAMLFLVHFVVDVHQPLHVGYASDLGGNKLRVLLGDKKTNLHAVWDTGLLQSESQSVQDYRLALLALARGQVAVWQDSLPTDWVEESLALRAVAYDYRPAESGDLAVLSDSYIYESKQIIDVRLAQAGVRLAAELNQIWCPKAADRGEAVK